MAAFQHDVRDCALGALDTVLQHGSDATTLGYSNATQANLTVVAQATRLALAAAVAGLGECRETTPYAPLYPLRENGEFKWCCTHQPPHC